MIPPSRRRRYGGQALGTWIIEDGTLDRADRRRWVLGDALRLAPAGLAQGFAALEVAAVWSNFGAAWERPR